SRQTRTRAYVNEPTGRDQGRSRQAIQEVLIEDRFGIGDGGQIDLAVPARQQVEVAPEPFDLAIRESDPETCGFFTQTVEVCRGHDRRSIVTAPCALKTSWCRRSCPARSKSAAAPPPK